MKWTMSWKLGLCKGWGFQLGGNMGLYGDYSVLVSVLGPPIVEITYCERF